MRHAAAPGQTLFTESAPGRPWQPRRRGGALLAPHLRPRATPPPPPPPVAASRCLPPTSHAPPSAQQVPAAAAAAPSMGIFDRLRGKREDAAAEMSSAEAAAAVSPSLDLTEHAGAPAQAGPSARQQQFTKTFGVPASEQLYNPYDGARGLGGWGGAGGGGDTCGAACRCRAAAARRLGRGATTGHAVSCANACHRVLSSSACVALPACPHARRRPLTSVVLCRPGRRARPPRARLPRGLPGVQAARVFVQRGGAGAQAQLEREPDVLHRRGVPGRWVGGLCSAPWLATMPVVLDSTRIAACPEPPPLR